MARSLEGNTVLPEKRNAACLTHDVLLEPFVSYSLYSIINVYLNCQSQLRPVYHKFLSLATLPKTTLVNRPCRGYLGYYL